MYKLEFIWINPKENKFFEESDAYDKNKAIEFFKYYLVKHNLAKKTIDPKDFPHEIHFNHLPDGSWTKVARVFGFGSAQHVEQYYLDGAKEGLFPQHTETKRKWQQENQIAAEVNILDADNNVVKLLSSCHGNICVKFGNCDNADGCHIKPTLPQMLTGKFPIFHIKELKV